MAEEGVVATVVAGTGAVADPAAAALAAAEALPDHNGNRVETLAARKRALKVERAQVHKAIKAEAQAQTNSREDQDLV